MSTNGHAAADATKELISIIMGLAAANVVGQFVMIHMHNGSFYVDDRWEYFVLGALLFFIVRFFHGNVLNIDYHLNAASASHPVVQGITFFVVMVQSFALTFIPYFFHDVKRALELVAVVFIVDLLWLVQLPKGQKHEKVWGSLVAFGVVVILASQIFNFTNPRATIGFVLFVTGAVDYGMNWKFYFPQWKNPNAREAT